MDDPHSLLSVEQAAHRSAHQACAADEGEGGDAGAVGAAAGAVEARNARAAMGCMRPGGAHAVPLNATSDRLRGPYPTGVASAPAADDPRRRCSVARLRCDHPATGVWPSPR